MAVQFEITCDLCGRTASQSDEGWLSMSPAGDIESSLTVGKGIYNVCPECVTRAKAGEPDIEVSELREAFLNKSLKPAEVLAIWNLLAAHVVAGPPQRVAQICSHYTLGKQCILGETRPVLREGIQPVRLEIAERTPLEHVMTFLGQALAWLPTHYDTHLTQESEPERFTNWLDDFIYWPYVPGRRIDFDDLYDTPEEHPDA